MVETSSAGAIFKFSPTANTIVQKVSFYDFRMLLTSIGSIFTSVSGIYGLINMLLTKDAEDVTIMNKSYTFKPKKLPEHHSPKTKTQILIQTPKKIPEQHSPKTETQILIQTPKKLPEQHSPKTDTQILIQTPKKLPEQHSAKTQTQILIQTMQAFSHLNFTWKEQLCLRICFCCRRKERHSKMYEKGRKKLYAEMDLIRLIK